MKREEYMAMYDYIQGHAALIADQILNNNEHTFDIKAYMEKQMILAQTQKPFLALLQLGAGNQDYQQLSITDLKKENKQIVASRYDIVHIEQCGDGDLRDDMRRLHDRLKGSISQDCYGHSPGTSDVYIIGKGNEAAAYYIDEDGYHKVYHFVDEKLMRKIQADIDVKQEYEMLQNITADPERKQYLIDTYRTAFIRSHKQKIPPGGQATEKKNSPRGTKEPKLRFSDDEIQLANATDMVDLLSHLGYTLIRVGSLYSTKEIDSLRIYNRRSYCRWSDGSGGTAIQFLQNFQNMGFKEAVAYLLNFNGVRMDMEVSDCVPRGDTGKNEHKVDKKDFVLPDKADNYRQMYAYLIKTRGLEKETVDFFVSRGDIYEEATHHNIVFVSKDKDGVAKHAFMRGTNSIKAFKCDVAGNDKNYGFNIVDDHSDMVTVTEGALDAMSGYEMDYMREPGSWLALGMTSDNPLEQFLKDHPNIKIICLCLDCDDAGDRGTEKLMEKYRAKEWWDRGYTCVDVRPQDRSCKDLNELLIARKAQAKRR